MLGRSILARTSHTFARHPIAGPFATVKHVRRFTEKGDSSDGGFKPTGTNAESNKHANETPTKPEGASATEKTREPSLSELIKDAPSAEGLKNSTRINRQKELLRLVSAGSSQPTSRPQGYRAPGWTSAYTPISAMDERANPMHKLILHVHASSNNTIMSLTDANGRIIVNASGGSVGFKKAQRGGFEAAYQATAFLVNAVIDKKISVPKIELRFKGFGPGRDASFKAITSLTSWNVCAVVDTTPVPFNGCRPKKARRL